MRLTTLLTLSALTATAALAPTSAAAMDGAGSLGTCIPITDDTGQGTWNGYEFCAIDPVSGGGGGAPSAATPPPLPTRGNEDIVIQGYLNSNPCRVPSNCLPRWLRGEGRTLGFKDGSGPGSGGPRAGGGAGSGETKGSSKKLTKEECAKLRMNDAPFRARLGELNWQIGDLEETVQARGDERKDVSRGLIYLRDGLPNMRWWASVDEFVVKDPPTSGNFMKRLLKHYAVTVEIRTKEEEISSLDAKRLSSLLEIEKLKKEVDRLLAQHRPTENTLSECKAAYGRPSR